MTSTRRRFLQTVASAGLVFGAAPRLRAQGMSTRGVRPAPRPKFSGRPWPVTLIDVAPRAGLTLPTVYGEEYVKKYIVEANGAGIAFYDYDHDGWLDIFIANGTRHEGFPPGQEPTNHLYRNNRDGTFTDVTAKAGITHSGWCYGVCVGDYDNDGHDDLFLTYFGKNVLYHNNGDGTFTDVTEKAGLGQSRTRYSAGCTLVDYDRDGHLDLFVSRYIDLDLAKTPVGGSSRYCKYRGVPVNCGPLGLTKETCSLYHNNGDGTFTEVTEKAGILKPGGRYGLSSVAFDYNNDGWPDLFVACDSSPNLLFRNNHDGTFAEVGMEAGCAVNGDGLEQANMGVAVGDYDGDGYLDLFLPHFSEDTPILYHNTKGEFFDDVTNAAGLAVNTQYVCWGVDFADLDNDGWLDIFHVNGTVYPEVEKIYPDYKFKQPRVVYRNLGNGGFEEVSQLCGAAVLEPHSSRGCAFGDFDNDGNIDVLVWNMNEPPSLLKNENRSGNHWLSVKTAGTKSNRSGIGARVTVTAGGRRQIREVLSGCSYISQSDLRQHFGLGPARKADELEIRWPCGQVDKVIGVDADQFVTVLEGRGLLSSRSAG
ncbi:MAG TPA: CRTAC1 family protein [Terriglobia bacterium]|nr:CRTAC1 family protein [Terriglobia bacterium]